MHDRFLIGLALAFGLGLASCDRASSYGVEDVTLGQIADDLAAGKTTSVAVTQAYIARIEAHDDAQAVLVTMPDALAQAAASDRRRKDRKTLGPLDGIPVLLKDNIDAAGLEDEPPPDSEIARRLRARGAVILGKTTMGDASAAAVAGTLGAAVIDTDTGGSLITPAGAHGVVGLRPTIGLVSRRGIVPMSLSLDTAGPMARDVRGIAIVLTALAGRDVADAATVEADRYRTNYAKLLSTPALQNVRVGVYRGSNGLNLRSQAAFDAALSVLEAQGARLVDVPEATLPDLRREQALIVTHEFKEDLDAYREHLPDDVKGRRQNDLYGQAFYDLSAGTPGRVAPVYWEALEFARRRAGVEGLAQVMADYVLTAVVAPTDVMGDSDRRSFTSVAAMAGYPILSIPMGQADGKPIGLSLVGPPWSEDLLLAMGYVYEQATHIPRGTP